MTTIEYRLVWLTRLLGAGVLALVAVTWKLWTPQDVFPRVPLFRWAPPDWWDWASLALIIAGGIGLLIRPPRHVRTFAATLAFGLAIAFVCDQHRLQPWAWQFFILALLVALADDALLWNGWQWLTISIYFYSALSKFDMDFMDSMGRSFVQVVNEAFRTSRLPFPLSPQYLSLYPKLAWIFPIGELLCAVLLLFPRGRRYGWIAVVLMHMALIRILGPAGLQHSRGVVVWNVFFIFQAVILFGWNDCVGLFRRFVWPTVAAGPVPFSSRSVLHPACATRIAQLVLGVVLVAPASTPWGLWDFWLGWAVYVKPYEEAIAVINAEAFEGMLPAEMDRMALPRSLQFPSGRPALVPINIQAWSLRSLQAPAYPHIRCSLGVALDCADRWEKSQMQVRIVRQTRWQSRSRLTTVLFSTSARTLLTTPEEVHEYSKLFWFNAYPTSMYRRAARERAMKDDG